MPTTKCVAITPKHIKSLNRAENLGYRNIFYHPKILYEASNDNSTIKLFRTGSFNVVSMGDVENENIGAWLKRQKIFTNEIDVLLLAHHGANCATNSKRFLKAINPKLAVCSSQFDNEYEHPKQEVRDRLYNLDIRLMTTKTGDVIVYSLEPHMGKCRAINYKANSTAIYSTHKFYSKKNMLLQRNQDTIRGRYAHKFSGIRR